MPWSEIHAGSVLEPVFALAARSLRRRRGACGSSAQSLVFATLIPARGFGAAFADFFPGHEAGDVAARTGTEPNGHLAAAQPSACWELDLRQLEWRLSFAGRVGKWRQIAGRHRGRAPVSLWATPERAMALSYEEAVTQLFQAAHERFVAERKRLAAELKAAGDKVLAARLSDLNRPPLSAWAVNQLWWHAQPAFEQLFAVAARQRAGDREAAGAHRQKLAELRARAAELLRGAGHPATESTLRRVTMTLAALAAAGGFAPDSPGALTADRDPPGFEAVMASDASEPAAQTEPEPERPEASPSVERAAKAREKTEGRKAEQGRVEREAAERKAAERKKAEREQAQRLEEQRRREEELERRRVQAERARREAERARLNKALRDARAEVDSRAQVLARQREALTAAEQSLREATDAAEAAEARVQAFEAEAAEK